MPAFPILNQFVTARVRVAVGANQGKIDALYDAIAKHRQGDPGEINMDAYNKTTIEQWAVSGTSEVSSAVWSQFTLPDNLVILIKTAGDMTSVTTRQEYDNDYSYVPPVA